MLQVTISRVESIVGHAFLSAMGYRTVFEKNTNRFSVSPNAYSLSKSETLISGEIEYNKGIPIFISMTIEVNNEKIKRSVELLFYEFLSKIFGMKYRISCISDISFA